MSAFTRRTFLGAAGAASLAACGSTQSQPESPKRPNLLLLFPDQWRFDWLGSNPEVPVRTPNVDALAARGVRFTKAVCASPLCAPSRACLAAGKEYDRCRVPGNAVDFPLDQTTYYQLLRDAGYHVMGCGKFDLHKATEDWGLDGKRLLADWGFSDGVDNAGKFDAIRSGAKSPKDPYMGYLHQHDLAQVHVDDFKGRGGMKSYSNTDPTPLPDHAYCDNWIGERGLDLLRNAPADAPWFLQVNFTGPHDPLDATASMLEPWRKVEGFPEANRNTEFPPEKHQVMRQNYSAMCANLDAWVGRFLAEVEKRGELDNTLVVFSSDHGEMLGDHNRWKKRLPYQPSVGVPLMAAGPGVQAQPESGALVSVMDLAATFLDYAGVDVPQEMDSRSLRPVLSGAQTEHREHLRSGLDPWRMVTDGKWKLVRGFDESIEGYYSSRDTPAYADMQQFTLLFDLDADPLENTNVAGENPEIVQRLESYLQA
ncbi:MAG: sulfatase-like hydrolase/transferase [Bryobacterales bacterium]|nr:sulfatase-like hydrolase/transferase [Bryobacterales bacterium]